MFFDRIYILVYDPVIQFYPVILLADKHHKNSLHQLL